MSESLTFVRVCSVADLPEVGAVAADVDGNRVAIVRDSAGDIHAIDDTCSHANVSLSEGEVEDCMIECWLHGSRFDLRTGERTALPAAADPGGYTNALEASVPLRLLAGPRLRLSAATGLSDGAGGLADLRSDEQHQTSAVQLTWEDASHALAVTYADGAWAVVRIGLDGTMEYAVPPREGSDFERPFFLQS